MTYDVLNDIDYFNTSSYDKDSSIIIKTCIKKPEKYAYEVGDILYLKHFENLDINNHLFSGFLSHRDDGPAYITKDYSLYYQKGFIHRSDGPAVIHSNGKKEYWIDGKEIYKVELSLDETSQLYHILFDYLNAQGYSKNVIYNSLKSKSDAVFTGSYEATAFDFLKKFELFKGH